MIERGGRTIKLFAHGSMEADWELPAFFVAVVTFVITRGVCEVGGMNVLAVGDWGSVDGGVVSTAGARARAGAGEGMEIGDAVVRTGAGAEAVAEAGVEPFRGAVDLVR